jgi:hypothetical protein
MRTLEWSVNSKKGRRLLCQGSRIKYGFIREHKKTHPVTLCWTTKKGRELSKLFNRQI